MSAFVFSAPDARYSRHAPHHLGEERKPDPNDERPPICPACVVTMGIIVEEDGTTHYVCLECGFSDETTLLCTTTTDG
jgi:hypothetical protein